MNSSSTERKLPQICFSISNDLKYINKLITMNDLHWILKNLQMSQVCTSRDLLCWFILKSSMVRRNLP